MKSAIILIILSLAALCHASTHYLIIHGTWSSPFDWQMPGGDFYEALADQVSHNNVAFFLWSGKNRDAARKEAAQKLVAYIEHNYAFEDKLILIGHSHGGNVALLASQIMGTKEMNNRIHALITLGTPICMQSYWPDMHVIEKLYNLFSFNDVVQPVLGCFAREFPAHECIANIEVLINRKEPEHSELHHSLVAHCVPQLSALIEKAKDLILYLDDDEEPCIVPDKDRDYKRERDRQIIFAMNHIMYYQQWRVANLLKK